MLRHLKKILWAVAVLAVVSRASGFSMWGPAEGFQTQDLDYGIRYLPFVSTADNTVRQVLGPGDLGAENTELGGTKNMGEGSRLNTPVITYAYDSTFLTYFGAKGEAAIDSAFTALNGLPASSSANLAKYMTQGNEQINYTAQALRMLDLKSTVMWMMIEHMGLIGETHTYDLAVRSGPVAGNPQCAFEYVVFQRNFDPVTLDTSDYVNGSLLTYQIGDLCPGLQVGDAMEQTAQTGLPPFSAVATREGLQVGGYYVGFTRDDVGGLRFLYKHNRYVNEALEANDVISESILNSSWSPVETTNVSVTVTTGALTAGFAGLLGGVEKIRFVKTEYDSALGTVFHPLIYHYTIPWLTNGVVRTLGVTRTVTAPDIIFTAGNLTFPGPYPFELSLNRTGSFSTVGAAVSPGENTVTPSVILPEMVVTFNNSGPIYYQEGNGINAQENSYELGFLWGAFDGSTNAPVLFPTGSSIEDVETQVVSSGFQTQTLTWQPYAVATNATVATGGAAAGQ
jgi:hypothetical protein